MNRFRTLAALLALAAVAAVAVAATPATAAPRGDDETVVAVATKAGSFKTLTMLLRRAGLAGTLKGGGPFTVFAPTDAAFAKVPKRTLNSLLASKAKLKAVLLYHVVAGKVAAADVVKLSSAKTLNGKAVPIRTAGTRVFVGGARVTKPDVAASNGVIHVIDRVLLPPAA